MLNIMATKTAILNSKNIEEFDIDKYEQLTVELSRLNPHDIEKELAEHTAIYSYYYGILVRAKRLFDDYTIALESETSTLKVSAREVKKVSVEALKDMAQSNANIIDMQRKQAKYEEIYGLVKALCQTLEHKKDMLVQLSANKRSETKLYT
jgi:hypothetical protein